MRTSLFIYYLFISLWYSSTVVGREICLDQAVWMVCLVRDGKRFLVELLRLCPVILSFPGGKWGEASSWYVLRIHFCRVMGVLWFVVLCVVIFLRFGLWSCILENGCKKREHTIR